MAEAPTPIRLTLVTGPQGSGKSRLINRLRAGSGETMLAIANEAGTTRLDDAYAAADSSLANACLCCRSGAFAGLLERVLREIDNGRMPCPDHLLFETSGSADPMLLLSEVIVHPYLGRRYQTAAVVMPLVAKPTEPLPLELLRQIESCSVLVGDDRPWRPIIGALNPQAETIPAGDLRGSLQTARFDMAQRTAGARSRLYAGKDRRRPAWELARNL